MNRAHTRPAAVLLVVLGLLAVAGCGSGDSAGRNEGAGTAPKGTILFTRIRTDGKPALFTIGAGGFGLRLFVTHASSAAVSPDGQRVLFVRDGAIWQMRRDASGQRQVTHPPRTGSDYDPAWAPSGRVLYFSRQIGPGGSGAFSMRVDGTMLRRLTAGCVDCIAGDDELAPSPDGRVVAYTSWDDGPGAHFSMISAMTQAGHEADLGFETTGAGWEQSPAWAPDGQRLAFAAIDTDPPLDRNQVGLSGLYVSARTGPARRVFRPAGAAPYVREPAWSADGRWIAFTREPSDGWGSDIWVAPAEGGVPRPITSGKAVDWSPAWLPPAAG